MKIITSLLSSFKRNKEQPQHKEQTQESLTLVNHDDSVETSIQYIEENNVIYHTDGTDIDKSEIPYLIEIGLLHAIEQEKTSPNPKYHRTYEEKQLRSQFSEENFDYLRKKTNEITDLSIKANETITDIDTTISDCNKAIKVFYDLKNFCYQTEGGKIYFQNMWEYCHNSQNPCFCFIEKTEKRLQDLTENYAERKKYYEKMQYVKHHLKNDLIAFLSEHENILQKNVYSYFDADFKDNIALLLYNMDKSGEITRIKHRNTYQLSLK